MTGLFVLICKDIGGHFKEKRYNLLKNSFEEQCMLDIQNTISGSNSFIRDHSSIPMGGARIHTVERMKKLVNGSNLRSKEIGVTMYKKYLARLFNNVSIVTEYKA